MGLRSFFKGVDSYRKKVEKKRQERYYKKNKGIIDLIRKIFPPKKRKKHRHIR